MVFEKWVPYSLCLIYTHIKLTVTCITSHCHWSCCFIRKWHRQTCNEENWLFYFTKSATYLQYNSSVVTARSGYFMLFLTELKQVTVALALYLKLIICHQSIVGHKILITIKCLRKEHQIMTSATFRYQQCWRFTVILLNF